MVILLATRNPKKRAELQRLLRGLPVRFLSMDQFPRLPMVQETGKTFKANAIKKAVEISRRTILPVLAEDSGLEVQALSGRPGVRTARFSGPDQNDERNNVKLLRVLRKVIPSQRGARFVCVMAFAIGGRVIRIFEGSCSGQMAQQLAGKNGFGYDPLFVPRGYSKTMGQLKASIKDRISHRTKAVRQFRDWIKKAL